MVHAMTPGSVILDLAAERGGNCEVTVAGATIIEQGVTVIGPVNVPATVPRHASEMYARNIATFLKNMITKDGQLNIDLKDESSATRWWRAGAKWFIPRCRPCWEHPLKR